MFFVDLKFTLSEKMYERNKRNDVQYYVFKNLHVDVAATFAASRMLTVVPITKTGYLYLLVLRDVITIIRYTKQPLAMT